MHNRNLGVTNSISHIVHNICHASQDNAILLRQHSLELFVLLLAPPSDPLSPSPNSLANSSALVALFPSSTILVFEELSVKGHMDYQEPYQNPQHTSQLLDHCQRSNSSPCSSQLACSRNQHIWGEPAIHQSTNQIIGMSTKRMTRITFSKMMVRHVVQTLMSPLQ